MDTTTQIAFEGTKEQQELAARAFEVMRRKGLLFAANAPIKMSLESIAQALTKEGGTRAGEDPGKLAPRIEQALLKNETVFARADSGEFVTTRSGRAHRPDQSEQAHTFRQRINVEATVLDAQAAKEYQEDLMSRAAVRAERTSALVDTVIEIPTTPTPRTQFTPPAREAEMPAIIPPHLIPQTPAIEETEAQAPAMPRRAPAEVAPAAPVRPAPVPQEEAREREPAVAAQQAPPVAEVAEPLVAEETPPQVVEEAPVVAPPVAAPTTPAKPKPATPAAPAAPTGPVEVRLPSPEGPITVDINRPLDDILADERTERALVAIIGAAVEGDSRLVRFGSDIFPEETLERFSKGDFRRIKDYLDEPETGGVASDRDIMAEVLNRRVDHPDYERLRFSLNYRLLKEKKDFDFVGIDSDRLWVPANTSPVVPPARKPAEIGQDYRYLEDPAIVAVEEEEEREALAPGPIEYSLTYYEYENGVLPYDRRFKSVFPGPVFEDQRASLLRLEVPQLYGALLAELRYPTGNRGGFIMGLNELFTEHMVPGARFTLTPTDRGEDVFEIHFKRHDETESNILQVDERRGRYVFRPVSYTIETDPTMFLEQERFGKLHNHRKLEEAERRRPDVIIANAFEAVGEENDGKLWAAFDDLFPVVNIERPISRSWLKTLLSGAYPFFYADEETDGAYFYDSSRRPA